MSSRTIRLDAFELFNAAQVGLKRRLNGIHKRDRDGVVITEEYGNPTIGWNRDIHGAIGEYAFAKLMNLPWNNPTVYGYDAAGRKLPDVGKYEVRSIEDPERGLIIRSNDTHPCVLMLGRDIEWHCMGWIQPLRAREIGRVLQTPGRPDCWIVPKSHLAQFLED